MTSPDRDAQMVEKCSKTMCQLRQDHGEMVQQKRDKAEKDLEINKLKVKIEMQKRVQDAQKFIEELNMDDEETQKVVEAQGLQKYLEHLY